MRLWLLAIALVALVACGGGGLSEEEVESIVETEVARAVRREVPRAVKKEMRALAEATIAAAKVPKSAEWDAVQAAIDVMMVDNRMTTVTANGTAAKIIAAFDFDSGAGTQNITEYLRDPSTTYCYTWDSTGKILTQADC